MPLGRQLIHYRAAWVGQSDEFGHLVKGLSCGIVKRLTQHAHVVGRIHTDQLCVSLTVKHRNGNWGASPGSNTWARMCAHVVHRNGRDVQDQAMALANDVPTCNDP